MTETRPRLQGAKLTAYELSRDKIPVTLITDSMAGFLMSQGAVHKIIVGADRILGSGHVINKIGTSSLAILAKHYDIPFYSAAPRSTFDLETPVDRVVIEERAISEVEYVGEERVAPSKIKILNPAFDVTTPDLVTGLITERGLIQPPLDENIKKILK